MTIEPFVSSSEKIACKKTPAKTSANLFVIGECSLTSISDKAKAESELGGALGKFNLVVENYPDLKANQNFLALQEELTSTENKISFARQSYNDQVLFFNNKIEMFPSSIIAGMFNFVKSEFFELTDAAERAVPKVEF